MTCNNCIQDQCEPPCGCAEPTFSIEALSTDPTTLRFNVNGKSVWYDFEPIVKAAETCTTISVNSTDRQLNYHGECGDYTITAAELGSILHLADISDIDANSITNNGILNYRKDSNCAEGCEGISNGWVSSNPVEVGGTSLEYILGSDADGKMMSLMPPTDASTFSLLTWAGKDKAVWKKPNIAATAPVDSDNKVWRLYVDPATYELTIVKEDK